MLPEGWTRLTVADICTMQNGNGFGPEDWGTEGLPIIRIQNLNGGRNFDYFSGDVDPRWLVEPGQLLFAWAGTRGVSFGPTIWRGERGVLNQHIFKINAKPAIDAEWLYWALKHVTDRIESQAHGFKATLLHVKKSDIDHQTVLVPTLEEQQKQGAMLKVWDNTIENAEGLLANSRMQKRALIRQLLSGKKRLKEFVSSTGRVATRFGSLPVDWKHVAIECVASEFSAKNVADEQLPVLSCTKHTGLVDSLAYFNKRIFSEDTTTYKIVERNCFAYATNHIDEGSIGYQNLYDKALISPMYTVFKTSGAIDNGFLFKLLKTEHYRQIFAANTNASVDRRGSLRWGDFKKIEIPLPSLKEQVAISAVIDVAEQEVSSIEKQLIVLREEKRALMQQLLTGKRRVRIPACEEEASLS